MVAKSFENGALVWAKMKGFSPWPGKITDPPEGAKIKKAHHYVFFFGSNNYAWISDENIELHNEKLAEKYSKGLKKGAKFMSAVHIIVTKSKDSSKYLMDSEASSEMLTGDKKYISPDTKVMAKKKGIKKKHDQKNDAFENGDDEKEEATQKSSLNVNCTPKNIEKSSVARKNKRRRGISSEADNLSFEITPTIKPKIDKLTASDEQKIDEDSSDLNSNASIAYSSFSEVFSGDISSESEVDINPSILFMPRNRHFRRESPLKICFDDAHEINKILAAKKPENTIITTQKQKDPEIPVTKTQNDDEIIDIEMQGNLEISNTTKNRNDEISNTKQQSVEITNTEKQSIDEISKSLTDMNYSDLNLKIPSDYTKMCKIIDISSKRENLIDPSVVDEDRSESPTVDMEVEHENIKRKCIYPTKKKIGFLGLGTIGQRLVKNLMQSGHSVTVWNRTASRCENFTGALKAQTPADVVNTCDIIFSCMSSSAAAKHVFFMNDGVSSGLRAAGSAAESKGFVELTTLDPAASKTIYTDVNFTGARYLEAQLQGTKEQANDGTLFILIAGDRSLFDDCDSCFRAMGATSLFISPIVGTASTYNIIHKMLIGTIYAALAESLAVVDNIGLEKDVFIDTFMLNNIQSIVQLDKNHSMGNINCDVNIPLKYVQNSLSSGLELGSSVSQPLNVTAAANETYKYCKLLKYGNHDVSAAYEVVKQLKR